MGNAKYVGRVGALAVALGIGTGVATSPWVAVAEPSHDSSSASESESWNASSASEGAASTGDAKPAISVATSGSADDAVSVIDTATNTVTATFAVGDNPRGVAISPDGTDLYVTIDSDGSVTVITLG